ncbi:glycine betaine ABC transporter substrate-binding protein [Pseudoduganella umbonata]|uniref:Glycine betaine/proline transport system substrate-binding protein n=1 Tax=Pseudoduganella umbonata TaxID=864828 RepID=A0A4P8HW36_9BURK|nr:glycine betaine ABC transporter substrate-binding protein [Pseudoduganella umbonata]MBB3222948.1 glycine betaine/proline transport system substrate-binding protein [Pseudoduganella umbonata]QCP13068.1 glycine/betaine ABC transporter substrate-binding protein [Pseudoduganella umbonata]
MKRLLALTALSALAFGATSHAADAPSCRVVKMADPGWTDIAATNALSGIVLEALGYEQKVLPLSVPITYAGLQKNQVDVFLGNWMPAQRTLVEPLLKSGAVEQVRANLPQARFTLAVPEPVARAGVRTFADLAKHADKFGKKIYGIESGAPANAVIKKLLASKSYGLDGWTLVESSEQGMLSQVARATRGNDWIVFLAWEPHQMNNTFKLSYLDGAADDFGPASVHTVTRKGYRAACPNAARLFAQIEFTAPLEHAIIADVTAKKATARAAALRQLKAQPALLERWLAGVTTLAGTDAKAAVLARLARP